MRSSQVGNVITAIWQLVASVREVLTKTDADVALVEQLLTNAATAIDSLSKCRRSLTSGTHLDDANLRLESAFREAYLLCDDVFRFFRLSRQKSPSIEQTVSATASALRAIAAILQPVRYQVLQVGFSEQKPLSETLSTSRVFAIERACHSLRLQALSYFLNVIAANRPITTRSLDRYLDDENAGRVPVSKRHRILVVSFLSRLPRGPMNDQWRAQLQSQFSDILLSKRNALESLQAGWWIWFSKEAQDFGKLQVSSLAADILQDSARPFVSGSEGNHQQICEKGELLGADDARGIYDQVYYETVHPNLNDALRPHLPEVGAIAADAPNVVQTWNPLRLVRTPFPQLLKLFEGDEALLGKTLSSITDAVRGLINSIGGDGDRGLVEESVPDTAVPQNESVRHTLRESESITFPDRQPIKIEVDSFRHAESGTFSTAGGVDGNRPAVSLKVCEDIEERRLQRLQGMAERRIDRSSMLEELPEATHSGIRNAWRMHFSEHLEDQNCCDALAWATHPWPDLELDGEVVAEITAELLPGMNSGVNNSILVAADRLWRFAAVFDSHKLVQLKEIFETYARIAEAAALHDGLCLSEGMPRVFGSVLLSPTGRGVSTPELRPDLSVQRQVPRVGSESLSLGLIAWLATLDIDDLSALWGEPSNISVSDLGAMIGVEPLGIVMESFLRTLDERSRELAEDRLLSSDRITGVAIAEKWGLTRSRVGQLEGRVRDKMDAELGSRFNAANSVIRYLTGKKVLPLIYLEGIASRLCGAGRIANLAANYLILDRTRWVIADGWVMPPEVQAELAVAIERTRANANTYGLVDMAVVEEELLHMFRSSDDLEAYVTTMTWCRIGEKWLITNTLRGRVVAALHLLGRPATREEIAESAGISFDQVRAVITNVAEIVRATKTEWGFLEWIDDPYDGIVEEIKQRIDSGGGAAVVAVVVHEITQRFGVSENSVRAYMSTDAFEIRNGHIYLRQASEFTPRGMTEVPNAVQVGGLWGQRVVLHSRYFEGYSLGVSNDIAFHNGLRPGNSFRVVIGQSAHTASLIWREQSLTRRIDVGRVREYLMEEGFSPEDEVIVVVTPDRVDFLRESELSEVNYGEATQDRESLSEKQLSKTPEASRDPLLDFLGLV